MVSVLLEEPDHIAESYWKTALDLQPNHPEILRQLAELCLKNALLFEARSYLERLASVTPPSALLLHRLACVSGECGEAEQAKKYFRQAAQLHGGQDIWRHKHLAYCPAFFENEQQIEDYWKKLNEGLDEAIAEDRLYNWKTLANEGFTHSFNLPHLDRGCTDVLEKFATLFAPSFAHFERPTWKRGEKIRVGFLVTPGHEGGFLRLCSGLIDNLDPDKFEVCLIYNETTSEKYAAKFHRNDLVHVRYTWNFEQSVRTIKAAHCDVIYFWKVGADPWNFFLPMCRLAPVQCTSWSTQGTSGVSHIDYYVSWSKAELPDAQKFYTENLFLLETTPLYEPFLNDVSSCSASREELRLPEEATIYFCPHQQPKYHPKFDRYLDGILENHPSAYVVLLLDKSREYAKMLIDRMSQTIEPSRFKRMIFVPKQRVYDYYRYMSQSTVILHSPVFSGEITSVDSFHYGIPYVTQTGDFLVQRYSTAFYEEFGIEGPAVTSQNEYVEQAVKLGTDSEYREAISRQIHEKRKVFFENDQTIKEWERFFIEVTSPETPRRLSPVLEIQKDRVVPINNIDINVSYGCNLQCRYCTHFCSWISGIVPLEDLVETFNAWHRKIAPERILLVGGEPLLHPELEQIVLESKRHWPKARIDLLTNGLLLPKRQDVLDALKTTNGYVYLSRHFQDAEYSRKFDAGLQCLKKSGIPFSIASSDRDWRKYHEIDEAGRPVPYESDPEKAWNNCRSKNDCPSLLENELYKCAHMAYAALGARKGMLPEQWKAMSECQALGANCTHADILALLSSEAVAQCQICPEKYEYVSLSEKSGAHPISCHCKST